MQSSEGHAGPAWMVAEGDLMKRGAYWLIPPVALAAAGLLFWHLELRSATAAAPAAAPAAVAVPVTDTVVKKQDLPIYLNGLGSVQAFNTVTVKARVDGQLDKLGYTEGQEVKEGDLIAQIDPRPFQAQLAQAKAAKIRDEAQLQNARLDLERFSNLATKEYASRQSVDTQRAQVSQLEAAVQGDQAAIDNATVQLGYTTIVSPINGRTGIRLIDKGNIIHANDAGGLVVITQLQPISVVFVLAQDHLDDITAEMAKGTLKVLAYKRDDTTLLGEGTLALIDNQIDPTTGTLKLKATFANANNALWPGEFVNARLLLKVFPNALTIPEQVVQRGPKGTFAYVIKSDGTVEQRPITTGNAHGGVVRIREGLAEGERVVLDGQYKLRDGARVQVSPSLAQQDAAKAS
jgi:multidrug efflux system membrane fusion protein